MPTEQEPKKLSPAKRKPGPHNPDQVAEFVVETTKSVNQFMNKMHNYESYAIEEGYQVLIAKYHHALCGIEDYFQQADKKLVLKLIDDTSCKLLRMTTAKDAEDREKCPDPRISTENLKTGARAMNRLAALPNFTDIQGKDREVVRDLFDSLQTAHAAIADASGIFVSLGQRFHPNQFQFLFKHSMCPLIQFQIPAHLFHPGKLRFTKQHLTDEELYEQCCVNTLLPRPHHPDLDNIPPKHPTRALAAAIHYQLCKCICTNFNVPQTEIADLFQVERKKFFTSIMGWEYDPGKKPTKSEKLKTSTSKEDKSTTEHTDKPQPSQLPAAPEVDPNMPPLEDVVPPWKKFKFKNPTSTVKPKHFQKNNSKHHSIIL